MLHMLSSLICSAAFSSHILTINTHYYGSYMNVHWTKKPLFTSYSPMLSTSRNVLFPGHNHLLTSGVDDPRWQSGDNQTVRWSAGVMT